MNADLTILFSSAGRRVELIECFRSAASALGAGLRVLAVDHRPDLSPACHKADQHFQVPICSDPHFIETVAQICRAQKVALVIPTIDPELEFFAAHRARFQSFGTQIAVGSPLVLATARDKLAAHQFLQQLGLRVPRTESLDVALASARDWSFPALLKPVQGSASIGQLLVPSLAALLAAEVPRSTYLLQEWVRGREYTVNCFFDAAGLRAAIPHLRLETRAGEVSKGITEQVPALAQIARVLGTAWKGEAFGALCFQAIVPDSGPPLVIDLNARFGGGYPLTHRAGAHFARWLLEPLLGLPSTASDRWREGVAMLRYDAAVFIDDFNSGPHDSTESRPAANPQE